MRPAMKRQLNTTVHASDGSVLEVALLPDCKNCYNACALKIRCIDANGGIAKKCARGVR